MKKLILEIKMRTILSEMDHVNRIAERESKLDGWLGDNSGHFYSLKAQLDDLIKKYETTLPCQQAE